MELFIIHNTYRFRISDHTKAQMANISEVSEDTVSLYVF